MWVAEHGQQHGFRVPDTTERSRAYGMRSYLTSLGLTDQQLFDAQGNVFDKDALLTRIGCPIARWLEKGASLPPPTSPHPSTIRELYETLRDEVASEGFLVATQPFQVNEGWLANEAGPSGAPHMDATAEAATRSANKGTERLTSPSKARDHATGFRAPESWGRMRKGKVGGLQNPEGRNACVVDSL